MWEQTLSVQEDLESKRKALKILTQTIIETPDEMEAEVSQVSASSEIDIDLPIVPQELHVPNQNQMNTFWQRFFQVDFIMASKLFFAHTSRGFFGKLASKRFI